MPDDHSELVPLLPIPNRTVKRLSADDSAGSRVKVGHRQALTAQKSPTSVRLGFSYYVSTSKVRAPSAKQLPLTAGCECELQAPGPMRARQQEEKKSRGIDEEQKSES